MSSEQNSCLGDWAAYYIILHSQGTKVQFDIYCPLLMALCNLKQLVTSHETNILAEKLS